MLQEASLVKHLKKQYVQCTACEHFCAIEPGGMGKCGVRRNYDGTLYLIVYGQAAALHVDPIEKKPLFHFLPTQRILSVGTVGCNFTCQFCQNWEISQAGDLADPSQSNGQKALPADLVATCRERGISMLAYTYNEPTVFFEYAYDTAKLAHAQGIRNVFVSSGFETLAALTMIEPYLDAINVDLKAFTDRFYRDVCGTRLQPVLRNIEHIARSSRTWIEITTLLIPGLNDFGGGAAGHGGLVSQRLTRPALASLGLSPGVPNAGPALNLPSHVDTSLGDRQGSRAALRLCRKRARQPTRIDPLPGLRTAAHQPELVQRDHPLAGARGVPRVRRKDTGCVALRNCEL